MSKTITIEDRRVAQILRDHRFTSEFPFLSAVAGSMLMNSFSKPRGCGSCGTGGRKPDNKEAYNKVKQAIAGMGPENREKFKRLLGVDQVKVLYRSTSTNKLIRVTY